ncbi:MAG: PaaI family thioesterase [Actinomycetes bacterium]
MTMSLGTLADRMGVRLSEARSGRVAATMPVEGNTQPYGLLNGGASAVLAETLGSIAGAIHAGPDHAVVGLDINCTHHRGVREGVVTAVATPISEGRTIASYEIRITDEDGRPVATARLTCLIRRLPNA